MENNLITQSKISDTVLVVNPGKSLDNNNAHELVAIITKAQETGYKYIIIDMTLLEFISSAGVGAILGAIETSREAGGDIILCNVAEVIRHVLEVLDLIDYLTIKDNLQEAGASCEVYK